MNVKEAYNRWSDQYDTNINKTRNLEATALRETLSHIAFTTCLEIGCGTGKNTEWLMTKADEMLAVDFSENMLAKARTKVPPGRVTFHLADINQPWHFTDKRFDLICFSLVLEHIEDLPSIFKKAADKVAKGGHIYIGELHPFKQYTGSKARFDTADGVEVVTCFNHHISDFITAAKQHGFTLVHLNEYFDDAPKNLLPRILTLLFQKA